MKPDLSNKEVDKIKKYMEKDIEVEFFGAKGLIDEYKELIRNELLRAISKYPVEKVGVWLKKK